MKIHEYQAKEILAGCGIAVPRGVMVDDLAAGLEAFQDIGFPLVVKAQVHVGGRGKAGAIRVVSDSKELKVALSQVLGMTVKGLKVKKVLIEKAMDIRKQFYVGITVDRATQHHVVMVSAEGGVEIEETAKVHPEKIVKVFVKGGRRLEKTELDRLAAVLGLPGCLSESITGILESLFKVYQSIDAQLVEINPLVLTGENKLIACDAKIIIDDNALFRQKSFWDLKEESEDNDLEKEAHACGLAYVKLAGDIGIIGNGAGLVMATMDEVKRAGGSPANFLDIGGGAKAQVMKNSVETVLRDPQVGGIFINIFGGITRCDEVAQGIITVFSRKAASLPIVVRLEGTRCQEAKDLLKASRLIYVDSMEEGAKKIVSMVQGGGKQ